MRHCTLIVAACIICWGPSTTLARGLQQATPPKAGAQNGTTTAAAKAFECGAPNGPCGTAIPASVTCAKGPGWCQAGYYCDNNYGAKPASCTPLPADCGAVGKSCCPSNADTPHTSGDDKKNRKPFCRDGSVCFFIGTRRSVENLGDIFAGNRGSFACTKGGEKGCGTRAGGPCCPRSMTMGGTYGFLTSNPTIDNFNNKGCEEGMVCKEEGGPAPPAAFRGPDGQYSGARPGVCTLKDDAKDTAKDAAKGVAKDGPKEAPKSAAKDSAKDSSKDAASKDASSKD